jgi:phosphatidyl-myo-inositol dimannoside synthase
MPAMRILMLNNEFPPLGGGTGTVNKAVLDRLAGQADLEIDLVTSARGREREDVCYAKRVRMIKVPVKNANIHHSSGRELLTYARLALREARVLHQSRPYDFCFAWSALPAGWVACRLRRSCGLPYLVRVCGVDIPGFERRYALVYKVLAPVIRSVWRNASAVVAKCEGEREMIHAADPSVAVTLVPNGVDLAAFPDAREPANGPFRILCVGRLIRRKRQDQLITAISLLKERGIEAWLELVGTGDEEAAYRAEADRLGVSDRVTFAGYVPREKIVPRYASAHVFALPSENEGMSVSMLEAMAAGLPVVVSRTGGTSELVEESVTGLTFDCGDVQALVAHLGRLAGDRALCERMGRAARAKAAQFSWDAVAETYRSLFAKMG